MPSEPANLDQQRGATAEALYRAALEAQLHDEESKGLGGLFLDEIQVGSLPARPYEPPDTRQ